MLSITFKGKRREAIAAGALFYFTGKKCKNGHLSKRYTRGGMCYACLKQHRDKNAISNNQRAKKHSKLRPDLLKKRVSKWRKSNPGKVAAITAKRRAVKNKATPKWLSEKDFSQISSLYEFANKKSEETGIKYHVDHIIPLQGVEVCGLHVPSNLRVVCAFENLSKHNQFIEGLENASRL